MKERVEIFRSALDKIVNQGVEIYQVSYYADDLDRMTATLRPDSIWRKYRRTETVRLYPGDKEDTAVYYVAQRHDFMPGFEVEVIQPLTDPNYMTVMDLDHGQIAHLGIKAEEFKGLTDFDIIRLVSSNSTWQVIQKALVRVGKEEKERYTIYQVDDFLPVKIVRRQERV